MVGPAHDGMYYCLGKEHGYCDRRSGTCFCNVGYQGVSCQDCSPTHYGQGGLCYPKLVSPGRVYVRAENMIPLCAPSLYQITLYITETFAVN